MTLNPGFGFRLPERFVQAFAFAAFLWAAACAFPLMAQGLQTEGTVDTIIDAQVGTEEKAASEEETRIAAAIAKSRENAAEVRKRFTINEVEIVFLPDLAAGNSGLEEKIKEGNEAINELRVAIEGNAMFFHAIDSRQVLLRDVIAVEFGANDRITIFAAGKAPQN